MDPDERSSYSGGSYDPPFESYGPPFDRDFLADLHADAVDPSVSAKVWPLVRADADAAAYIATLDKVVAALAAQREAEEPAPAWVTDRLDATLRELSTGGKDEPFTTDDEPVRLFDRRRRTRGVLLAAAAAAVVATLGAAVFTATTRSSDDSLVAGPATTAVVPTTTAPPITTTTPATSAPVLPPPPAPAPPPSPNDIDVSMITSALGKPPVGPLADPVTLQRCFRALGFNQFARVLGTAPIEIRGRAATLLLTPGRRSPIVTAFALGPRCGINGETDLISRIDLG